MSTIRVDNFGPSAGGTTYSADGIAKAWVNFNGIGTIATRDSLNVTSLTDNGTGDYTVGFTNGFNDALYNHVGMAGANSTNLINVSQNQNSHPPTTSAARYQIAYQNGTLFDSGFVGVAELGDLA